MIGALGGGLGGLFDTGGATLGGVGFGGVTVVDAATAGDYETVTLQATDSALLLDWLQAHAYDLPDALAPVLAPYVADGSYFLALRLRSDRDAGELNPLGFRFPGSTPVIPLQLTSVAAVPDMPLKVWLLGEHRAVPSNYLHVQVNEALIDWFSFGANYEDVVRRAADEAGGQAFATDAALRVRNDWLNARPWRNAVEAAGEQNSPTQFMSTLQRVGLTSAIGLLDALEPCTYLGDSGVTLRDFWNCPDCVDDAYADLPACAEAVLTELVEPAEHAEALVERHAMVTHLTSSVSPAEMTVDPQFVFNPDMPIVKRTRTATVSYQCAHGQYFRDADIQLTYPSGASIGLPSMTALTQQGGYLQWVGTDLPAAAVVEQTLARGLPIPVRDDREAVRGHLDEISEGGPLDVIDGFRAAADPEAAPVGGCRTGSGPAWLALLLPWLARRQRTGSPSTTVATADH